MQNQERRRLRITVPERVRMRIRKRLSWSPRWEGVTQAWAKGFIDQNMWRCDSIHEFDDLLQDAYLVFRKICFHYPQVVDPPLFMALFKTAISNQMHDKARCVRKDRIHREITSRDVSELYEERIGERTNSGHLLALLNQAPIEVKKALISLGGKRPGSTPVRSAMTKKVKSHIKSMLSEEGLYV